MSSELLNRIDGKLDKLDEKVDVIDSKVTKLDVHVEKNTKDLDEHMKRTDLNEQRIVRLEKIEQWLRGATWITLGLGSLFVALLKYFKG